MKVIKSNIRLYQYILRTLTLKIQRCSGLSLDNSLLYIHNDNNDDGSEAVTNTQKASMFNFICLVVVILKVYFSWGSRGLQTIKWLSKKGDPS